MSPEAMPPTRPSLLPEDDESVVVQQLWVSVRTRDGPAASAESGEAVSWVRPTRGYFRPMPPRATFAPTSTPPGGGLPDFKECLERCEVQTLEGDSPSPSPQRSRVAMTVPHPPVHESRMRDAVPWSASWPTIASP